MSDDPEPRTTQSICRWYLRALRPEVDAMIRRPLSAWNRIAATRPASPRSTSGFL